jgi:transposase
VKGQKNDYNDAEAIAEAALRTNLSNVSEKTQDQIDLQAQQMDLRLQIRMIKSEPSRRRKWRTVSRAL